MGIYIPEYFLGFGELLAIFYEFVQTHLYICVCSAYAPLMVKFRGGSLTLNAGLF